MRIKFSMFPHHSFSFNQLEFFPLRWHLSDFIHLCYLKMWGAAVVKWLSSWFAEWEVRGSIPGLATTVSDIGYPLLLSRDMAEILLKATYTLKTINQAISKLLYWTIFSDV